MLSVVDRDNETEMDVVKFWDGKKRQEGLEGATSWVGYRFSGRGWLSNDRRDWYWHRLWAVGNEE